MSCLPQLRGKAEADRYSDPDARPDRYTCSNRYTGSNLNPGAYRYAHSNAP